MLEALIIAIPRILLIMREVQAGVGVMSRIRDLWQRGPRREIERLEIGFGSLAVRGWRWGRRGVSRGLRRERRVSMVDRCVGWMNW